MNGCRVQYDFTLCSGGLMVCLVVLLCFGFLCIFIRNYVRLHLTNEYFYHWRI